MTRYIRPIRIFEEIKEERERQLELYSEDHDDSHSHDMWIRIFCRRVTILALPDTIEENREDLVKLAAAAIAAIESIDRKAKRRKQKTEQ